jgi:hypothetical protein
MKVSVRYNEILEESLREELMWLKEEFNVLFSSRNEEFTEKDKEIANAIMDFVLENTHAYDNIILYNLLFEAIENIEKLFPKLFD